MIVRGALEFYSETGTEGGHWAVFDTAFEEKVPPSYGLFAGREVFDPNDPDRAGRAERAWFPDGRQIGDPLTDDPDYARSSLFRGDKRGDRDADARLMARWGFEMRYAEDRAYGSTPATEPHRPYGVGRGQRTVVAVRWSDSDEVEYRSSDTLLVVQRSHQGLHPLQNGDRLTIYEADGETVAWDGTIAMRKIPLFTEHASGLNLHTGPQEGFENEEWARYFFEERPALLQRP